MTNEDLLIWILNLWVVTAPPPEWDLQRFPPKEMVEESKDLNCAFQTHIQNLQWVYPNKWWELELIKEETRDLWWVWNDLHCAQWMDLEKNKRKYLGRLKEKIGQRNYDRGCLPPPLPYWYFRSRD